LKIFANAPALEKLCLIRTVVILGDLNNIYNAYLTKMKKLKLDQVVLDRRIDGRTEESNMNEPA
jgi:hypothetical protein